MVAEQFTQWFYDPTDMHSLTPGGHIIKGVAVGSPGIMDVEAVPSGRFFHITRAEDTVGIYNPNEHVGPTLVLQDPESENVGSVLGVGGLEHDPGRYADQMREIASSPLAPYLSFAARLQFLPDFTNNDATTNGNYQAVFGGENRDLIFAPAGQVLLAEGGTGPDQLTGNIADDVLSGGTGDDVLQGGDGSDLLFGGAGTDTAFFEHPLSQYTLSRQSGTGDYLVRHNDSGAIDRLVGVELLQFGTANPASIGSFNWSGASSPPPPPPGPPPPPPPPAPTPGDDYGNSATTAFSISSNTAFSGKIETAGDQDWFRVTLQAGTLYGFSMTGGNVGGLSTLTSPHLYLYDSSGNLLDDASPVSINSVFQSSVPTTGTYYVRASADSNLGTGGYAVALTPLGPAPSPPPPHNPDPSNPVRLDLDSVEPRMEEDDVSLVYRVEYSGDLTGNVEIAWEVQGVGSHPTDSLDFVHTSGTVTLHEGHDYVYIRVTPSTDHVDEYDETFQLTIRVVSGDATISDDHENGTILNDDAGRIQPGADELNTGFQTATPILEETWNRGFINTPGDVDYFAVTLTGGATYDLVVLGDDDTSLIGGTEEGFTKLSDPQASLYDANHNLITSQFVAPVNSTRISYSFTPATTGLYYVAVREDGNNDIGQYFVKADIRVPADDFSASVQTTGHLVEGELALGNNERDGDEDWFAVNLVAGQSYSFYAIDQNSASLDGTSGGNGYIWPGWTDDLQIFVRNSQGSIVANPLQNPLYVSPSFPTQITFTASQTGTYFLSVSGAHDSGRYLAGYDNLASPTGNPVVLQPGPETGVDVTIANLRPQIDGPGLDLGSLSVGGLLTASTGSALRFDIDTLPDDASYAAIEIYFSGTVPANNKNYAAMAMVLGAPTALWDEMSGLGGIGDYDFEAMLPAPGLAGWYRIEITDLYNAWQNGTRSNTGIILLPTGLDTPTSLFYSSDYSDAALRPRLVVYERQPGEIRGTENFDNLTGSNHADRIFGLSGDDLIAALAGADWIDGGLGADIIDGGDGIDTVSYAASAGAVSIDLANNQHSGGSAEGDSLLNIEIVEGSAFSDTLVGSIFDDTLRGGGGDDVLWGRAGNDTLIGGGGVDWFSGGTGNDSYYVDNPSDYVVESAAEGSLDRIYTSVSYGLAAGVYVEILSTDSDSGAAPIALAGNELNNTIYGNAGNNVIYGMGGNDALIGGAGADQMVGGPGDDTFFVGEAGDQVFEAANGGFDNVAANSSYVLNAGAEVEVLSTTNHAGTAAISLNGNEFGQSLIGNAGNNYLDGGGGADVLIGFGGNDAYIVDADDLVVEQVGGGYDTVAAKTSYVLNAGADVEVLSTTNDAGTAAINLNGNAFGQSLIGNAGNNYLDGGGGADVLIGLGGNDTYIVDADDRVVEQAGGGSDNVAAKTSYVLNAGAEVEILSTTNDGGTAAISLNGNAFGQSLIGNAGANYLDGGGGADTLVGLGGNDTYIVDADDRVVEQAGGGNDTVAAKTSYVLNAGAEVEVLSTTNDGGTAAISLNGNEFGQVLVGNAGSNYLDGGGGADTLVGLGGNDTYIVDADDRIVEQGGGGSDNVAAKTSYVLNAGAEVEVLSTTNDAGTAAISLNGNEFGQALVGNAGANILDGGLGNDLLVGLGGADTFRFASALGANNVDAIKDFVSGTDKVALDDAVFTAIGGLGALNPNAFFAGAAAHDADDRIIYNQSTGQLFYDADGTGAGAAILFATLNAGTTLTVSDFTVI
jgi:Ca2+-binding RTX toxin-like protein